MTTAEPIFETERLVRHFGPDDLDDFAALCADPEVLRYVGDGTTLTREEVAHWIGCAGTSTRLGATAPRRCLRRPARSSATVAWCAPPATISTSSYASFTAARGAGRAMLRYVFGRSSLDRIYATIYAENRTSQRVAEKLGLRFDREVAEPEGVVKFYVAERAA